MGTHRDSFQPPSLGIRSSSAVSGSLPSMSAWMQLEDSTLLDLLMDASTSFGSCHPAAFVSRKSSKAGSADFCNMLIFRLCGFMLCLIGIHRMSQQKAAPSDCWIRRASSIFRSASTICTATGRMRIPVPSCFALSTFAPSRSIFFIQRRMSAAPFRSI